MTRLTKAGERELLTRLSSAPNTRVEPSSSHSQVCKTRPGTPMPPAPAQAFSEPDRQAHLSRAARRGWVCLESLDCELWRLRTLDGRVTPWLSYRELTARYGGPKELDDAE
jgi:hypothetical protein